MIESAPWPIVRLAKGCVGTCGLTEYGGEYEDLQHRSLLGLGEAWHMHQEFIDLRAAAATADSGRQPCQFWCRLQLPLEWSV